MQIKEINLLDDDGKLIKDAQKNYDKLNKFFVEIGSGAESTKTKNTISNAYDVSNCFFFGQLLIKEVAAAIKLLRSKH